MNLGSAVYSIFFTDAELIDLKKKTNRRVYKSYTRPHPEDHPTTGQDPNSGPKPEPKIDRSLDGLCCLVRSCLTIQYSFLGRA